MRKLLMLFSFVVSLQAIGGEVKCKCNEVPFEPDPPCAKACIVSIIRYSNLDKLVATAELSSPQQKAIKNVRKEESSSYMWFSIKEGLNTVDRKLDMLLGRPVSDVHGAPPLIENLNEVEIKIFLLPGDKLKEIAATLPLQIQTLSVPEKRVKLYEFEKEFKKE
jgi:hypothetical protein